VLKLKTFLFWFALEFVLYALIVANGRAYNQGLLGYTFVTDMTISGFNFFIMDRFVKSDRNRWAFAGCVCGGGMGSICSILLTKFVYGQ
jgi:hypothetical protein